MASLTALLVSAGVLSTAAIALEAAVPSIFGPLGPQLPPPALGWFRSWFGPPYHFVAVNVIIAAIAATSRYFQWALPETIAYVVVEATLAAAEVSSSALMATLKALLVSAGAVSIAVVALGSAVPSISGPLGPPLPPAQGWFLLWFRPPFPFVVINVIIAAIAATSKCFRRAQPERIAFAVTVVEKMEIMEAPAAAAEEAFDESKDFEEKREVVVVVAAAGNGGRSDGGDGYNGDCEGERKVALGRSASAARRTRVGSSEKALVPLRLVRSKAAGRDPLRGKKGKGGKASRRSNANMEHDWKAITEVEAGVGPAMSVTRHMNADDTDHQISLPELPPSPPMQKSMTFKDRTARQPPLSPIKSREELSGDDLSEDDVNRRADAFINKFKENLRSQG